MEECARPMICTLICVAVPDDMIKVLEAGYEAVDTNEMMSTKRNLHTAQTIYLRTLTPCPALHAGIDVRKEITLLVR